MKIYLYIDFTNGTLKDETVYFNVREFKVMLFSKSTKNFIIT